MKSPRAKAIAAGQKFYRGGRCRQNPRHHGPFHVHGGCMICQRARELAYSRSPKGRKIAAKRRRRERRASWASGKVKRHIKLSPAERRRRDRESWLRYAKTPKGKATRKRWRGSPKGQNWFWNYRRGLVWDECHRRWRESPKGRAYLWGKQFDPKKKATDKRYWHSERGKAIMRRKGRRLLERKGGVSRPFVDKEIARLTAAGLPLDLMYDKPRSRLS